MGHATVYLLTQISIDHELLWCLVTDHWCSGWQMVNQSWLRNIVVFRARLGIDFLRKD